MGAEKADKPSLRDVRYRRRTVNATSDLTPEIPGQNAILKTAEQSYSTVSNLAREVQGPRTDRMLGGSGPPRKFRLVAVQPNQPRNRDFHPNILYWV